LWHGAFYFADEADEDGKSAAVIEVYGEDDETVVDLCSWPSDNPDSFATIFGAEALGLARASNAATWSFGGALNLYRTPLRWLQAGCQGCVVLDHRLVPTWLGTVPGPIQAEDYEHARQLHQWLNPAFDATRILFAEGEAA
jgi:hypothetical protein